MTNRTRQWAAVLAIGLFVAACDDMNFEEFGEVSKLRTLAIRVDPPEIGPGDVAVIDALVVGADRPIRHIWEVCLFTDGPDEFYRCSEQDGEVLGAVIGDTPEVSLPYDAIVAVVGEIETICAELAEIELGDFVSLPDCDRGFPLTVRLTAEVADGQGDDREIATAGLLLMTEEEAALGTANVPPTIDGLVVDDVSSPGQVREIVLGDEPIALQALIDPDAVAQEYVRTDDDGTEEPDRERLLLTWFSTHGQIERTRTFFSEGSVLTAELQSNELDLSKGRLPAEVGDEGSVFLVLRDGRGGVDFLAQPFVVVESEN